MLGIFPGGPYLLIRRAEKFAGVLLRKSHAIRFGKGIKICAEICLRQGCFLYSILIDRIGQENS